MEQVCPFGLRFVPVWIGKTVYREYLPVTEKLSAEAAAEETMRRLDERIREESAGAELLEKTVDVSVRDGCCCADCVLHLRRNVGRTEEFTAETDADRSSP